MSYQRLYCLDVGQGMCTYFEEYDSNHQVIANALFDLGSRKNKERVGPPTLEFLRQRILAHGNDGKGRLSAMFLSHKDGDHVNLIRELLVVLPDMKIDLVFHGGRIEWYVDGAGNILSALGARTVDANTCVRNFSIGFTGFGGPSQSDWTPTWTSPNAAAYVIAVNTAGANKYFGQDVNKVYGRGKPDSELANSTSLGIYLGMFNVGAVIFGDATFSTFQFVNQLFLGRHVWLQNTFMLQAPHHGSRRTTFGLSKTNAEIDEESSAVVKTFASLVYGATIVVSSDNQHKHPSLETINAFLQYADHSRSWWSDVSVAPYHYVSVYFDIPPSDTVAAPLQYCTYQTAANFYSTLYYGLYTNKWGYSFPPLGAQTDPPLNTPFTEGMNWYYEVNKDSEINGDHDIPMGGVPSNRLPDDAVALNALFADARAALVEPRVAQPAPQPPRPSGAARSPAHSQRTLRRLKTQP